MSSYSSLKMFFLIFFIVLLAAVATWGITTCVLAHASLRAGERNEVTIEKVVDELSILAQIEGIDLPIPLSEKEVQLYALRDELLAMAKNFEDKQLIVKQKEINRGIDPERLTSQKLVKGLTPDQVIAMYGKPDKRSISAGHDWEERGWFYRLAGSHNKSNYLKFKNDKLEYWDLDFKFERK